MARPTPALARACVALATCLLAAGCAHRPPRPPRAAGVRAAAAPVAPPGAGAFADVPPGYWAAGAIEQLARTGVVEGVAPNRFDPQGGVTRAEFAAFLARLGKVPAGTLGPSFSDVPATAWYAPAVAAASGEGWMEGESSSLFDPSAAVTRAGALVALIRYLGLGGAAQALAGAPCSFGDCAAIPGWAWGSVAAAAQLGLAKGQPGGDLLPLAPLTRAQAAVLLARTQSCTPAQVEAVGARVAASAALNAAATQVEVGQDVTVTAQARDAAGAPVPAGFHFSLSGPAHLRIEGPDQVGVRVSGPGAIHLAAMVDGTEVAATLTLQASRTAALRVQGLPPDVLTGHTLTVRVSAIQADGAPDPAATPRVSVSLHPLVRGVPTVLRLTGGMAYLTLPAPSAGRYTLALQAPGLSALRLPYRVVSRPVGRIALSAPATLAAGTGGSVTVTLPGGADWPLSVQASGQAAGPAALPGEEPAPAVLSLSSAPATAHGGRATVAVRAGAPGSATVTVGVPGGALAAASATVHVSAIGAFGAAGAPVQVGAGQAGTVTIGLQGVPGAVWVEPVDPAGHPLAQLPATVRGATASVSFTPNAAGTWRFRWRAPGWTAVQAGQVIVAPGPAAALQVSALPSSILLPGQTAQLSATLVDRFGNPLPTPFTLRAGGAGPGLALTRTTGPGVVGTFTAGPPGTTTLTFTAPGEAPVALTLRTASGVASEAAGPGLWLTYAQWSATPDAQILQQAHSVGATHIYLQVASAPDGFYGGPALDDFLVKAHAAGIAVIAWISSAPTAPGGELSVVREVAAYRTPQGDRADGLALDVAGMSGGSVVRAYAQAARQALGPDGLLVAVTAPPAQDAGFPYAALAGSADVLAPLGTWAVRAQPYSYAQVHDWVLADVRQLRQLAGDQTIPVDLPLETFDLRPAGDGGQWSPSAADLEAAIGAAAAAGAEGVSYDGAGSATAAEWAVMTGPAGAG